MAAGVKERKSPTYDKVMKAIKAEPLTIRVGVIGGKAASPHSSDGETVGEIAVKHELGLGVPERSFIRAWFDANRGRLDGEGRKVAERVLTGKLDYETACGLLGARYAGEIQQFIADNKVQPPSSPATNALKGSSVTLIDSGVLRSSISYDLVKNP